jgi:hypothetical protein
MNFGFQISGLRLQVEKMIVCSVRSVRNMYTSNNFGLIWIYEYPKEQRKNPYIRRLTPYAWIRDLGSSFLACQARMDEREECGHLPDS